ncbi:zinc finger, C3HC4 type [Lecanosticta acicola]|uniref:Zinc finger, C3HC4 type n=1 Tax=Lecanosticta acicola TaxID=111012 RepID=A0AAI8Z5P1_9PEZI|nr:zinc finger, C3HC4 type [Lecanosticta acicola]
MTKDSKMRVPAAGLDDLPPHDWLVLTYQASNGRLPPPDRSTTRQSAPYVRQEPLALVPMVVRRRPLSPPVRNIPNVLRDMQEEPRQDAQARSLETSSENEIPRHPRDPRDNFLVSRRGSPWRTAEPDSPAPEHHPTVTSTEDRYNQGKFTFSLGEVKRKTNDPIAAIANFEAMAARLRAENPRSATLASNAAHITNGLAAAVLPDMPPRQRPQMPRLTFGNMTRGPGITVSSINTESEADPKVLYQLAYGLCGICKGDLVDPHKTSCGHVFCMECITAWLDSPVGRACPTCLHGEARTTPSTGQERG